MAAFNIQQELAKAGNSGASRLQEGNSVKVVKSYKGDNPEQLNLEVGDIVKVIQIKGDGWYLGEMKGKQGLYHMDYVQTLEATSSTAAAAKGDNLDDLFSMLKDQISSSGWLQENTAEKWVSENPELAKEYIDAAKKS